MARGQEVKRATADYTGDELCRVMATIVGCDSESVCEVVSVVIVHSGDDMHRLSVVTSAGGTPAEVAGTLQHAMAHLHGDCEECAQEIRRRRRGRR